MFTSYFRLKIWRVFSHSPSESFLRSPQSPETIQETRKTVLRQFVIRMFANESDANRSRSRSRSPIERKMLSSENQETNVERKMPSSETNVEHKMPSSGANVELQFAKLSEHAKAPSRGSELAAGYDLYSAYDYVVPAKGKGLVKTDIQIAVPEGSYGRVAPRSGLAINNFIDVGAGVVDQDYRGNVGVVLFNFSEKDFPIKRGDRIAQLICEKIFRPPLKELPALGETERGSKGYGSSGKN